MIFLSTKAKFFCTTCYFNTLKEAKFLISNNGKRIFCSNTEVATKEIQKTFTRPPTLNKYKNYKKEPIAWFLLVIPVSAFGLGTWQIQRKQWKDNLVQQLMERTTLPPTDFPYDIEDLKNMEYHPVRVKGTFHHDREMYMGPRTLIKAGKGYSDSQSMLSSTSVGYLVITPFTLSDSGLTILVNRGWVPSDQKSPQKRPIGQIKGEVELVGLVRHSEPRQPLGMKNYPERGIWAYRDLEKMAEIAGTEPILIDAVLSSTIEGGPIGGQTVTGLRNEHLSYIITWYSLSLITGYLWYKRYVQKIY